MDAISSGTDPLYIIGTERSGSNLLRVMLNAHSGIALPHPPHILRYFSPLEKAYGDLEASENLSRLVGDVLRLLQVHISPWDFEPDAERVVAEARPRDLLGVFTAIYDQFLERSGKRRWGCKSTFAIHHVDRILERDPEARFLWLVRDPRDVALSSKRSVFSPCHPYFTACLWREQQALGSALAGQIGDRRVLQISYEKLIADPEITLRSLCDFLEEEFEDGMLQFHETREAVEGAELSEDWRNTAQPVLRGNSGKYKAGLTQDEIRVVEAETGDLMRQLGYALDFPGQGSSPSLARRLRYRIEDRAWHLQVEWRSMRTDKNHWRRWNRGATVKALELRRRLGGL
jgi:hypothetical protein